VGSPVLRGRDFDKTDHQGAAEVAIVNEQMAARFWRGDALGRQVRARDKLLTIVGIVRDGSRRDYRRQVPPCLYFPAGQARAGGLSVVVRTQGNPLTVLPAVRDAVASLSPGAVINRPQSLSAYANTALGQERLAAWCLGALAVLALALCSVGIYGTMAFSVSQRTAEIGVRMACGATRAQVASMVLGGAARMAAAGVVTGAALALILLRYVRPLLYGVTATDSRTWLVVLLVLAIAVLAATIVPGLRAAKVDPAIALRSE